MSEESIANIMIVFAIYLATSSGFFMFANIEVRPQRPPYLKVFWALLCGMFWPLFVLTESVRWFFTGKFFD